MTSSSQRGCLIVIMNLNSRILNPSHTSQMLATFWLSHRLCQNCWWFWQALHGVSGNPVAPQPKSVDFLAKEKITPKSIRVRLSGACLICDVVSRNPIANPRISRYHVTLAFQSKNSGHDWILLRIKIVMGFLETTSHLAVTCANRNLDWFSDIFGFFSLFNIFLFFRIT